MTKKTELLQRLVRQYKEQTGTKEIDTRAVATWAHDLGMKLPQPPSGLDMLAKEFSRAEGEEVRTDKGTKRTYKANLAFRKRNSDGTQGVLWVDVDEAPRHRMQAGLTLYREQMVGEVVMGHNTADHWNRMNPSQEPLKFEADLTLDLALALNGPVKRRA